LSHPKISPSALAALLAGLAMLGPFSIDTYLPAFPQIQASIHASELEVQQTLTAYLFAFGIMTLWHGAFSDAFGRRNIILVSLAIFGIATLGCASAHSVEYLWAFRILQGLSSGAGTVVGRAIIRDLYKDAHATRLLSLVTMIFAIGPGVAPIIGGWIVKWYDWRAIFLFIFFYNAVLLAFCYRYLPETLAIEDRQEFHPRVLYDNYKKIFRSKPFWLKAGILALNFSGFFLLVASAPIFVTRHLGLGPEQFSWLFIPIVSGFFLGSLFANRLAEKWSVSRQIWLGYTFIIGAALFNLTYHLFFPPAIPWSVSPLFFYTFGSSLIAPGATLLLMDLFPQLRGTVASCQSFAISMLGAATAGVVSPLLSGNVVWLAGGQLAFGALGLVCWLLAYQRRSLLQQAGK
jgi:DHA1 family bicyclomycin/chloramphenicol resistance-like MFS transporter